ncbi:MAG: Rieske 2Fe-2S domain-containing protein [Burkholderiales bacterium]
MDSVSNEPRYADILRVGPGTIGGRYLRRFWQPVMTSAELATGHVKPLRILGEELTLYRGESGTVHLVAGRCPHRGVMLSLGFVRGEDLQCVYHGWTYDPSGQCVAQPAEPKPFTERIKIKSYPVREYLGLIFGYFGEGEAPLLPCLGDYEDDALYVREITTETWPCNYFDLIENSTDIAHTQFLHWHFGSKAPEKMEWTESEGGMNGRFEGETGKDDIYNRIYFQMPNSSEFAVIGRTGKEGYYTYAWRVPVDDNHAIRFNLGAYPRAQVEANAAPGMTAYAALRGLKETNADARNASDAEREAEAVTDVAEGLVSGREDMRSFRERSAKMNFRYLTNIQDCAVLMSLGPPATREFTESFGRTDVSIALMRRLWLRELKALAEGASLKAWRRPDFLWADVTQLHRKSAARLKGNA